MTQTPSRPASRTWRAARWLLLPGLAELAAGIRLFREVRTTLGETRSLGIKPIEQAAETQDAADAAATDLVRSRTRSRALICGAVLVVVLGWWTKLLLIDRESLVDAGSFECLALSAIAGSQTVLQAYLNWKTRTRRPGGIIAFLRAGSECWPR